MDLNELSAGGDPADPVVPPVGPDVGPEEGTSFFHLRKASAPVLFLGLSVIVVWLRRAMQVYYHFQNPNEMEMERDMEMEFFECETFDQVIEDNQELESPIEEIHHD